MNLNSEQRKAVEALAGPLLVTAGAGSGKTRVLTERFAHAVEVAGDDATATVQAILAITFTDKAAGELAERIRGALRARGLQQAAGRVDGAWISTIHGLCARLLRQNALEAGVDPRFTVADAVVAGSLKEQAFARVTQTALETREGTQALFAAYDFSVVAETVELVARELRSRGLEATNLTREEAGDARALHGDAVELFEKLQAEFGTCQQTATVAAHVEACADRAEALRSIDPTATPSHELAVEIWRALQGYSATMRGTKESAAAIEMLKQGRAALVSAAAGRAAEPFSTEICQLVGDYEAAYREEKDARATLDFDDLQVRALALLSDRPDVARAYREAFKLVMVDEFQDTDALQLAIVEALAGRDLCTVGDERQSIYSFRGADVETYRLHTERMVADNATRVELKRNYRSHPDVIGFVNGLFSGSTLFDDGLLKLVADREEPEPPLLDADEPRIAALLVAKGEGAEEARLAEAAAIAERFQRIRDGGTLGARNMVVLLRSYTHAETYARALRARGLASTIMGGSRFFGLAEVKLARALIRAIANPEDDEALGTVMASALGRVSDSGLWRLADPLQRRSSSLWSGLAERLPDLDEPDARAVARVVSALERARGAVGDLPVSAIFLRALEELDFDLVLMGEGDEGRQAFANVLKTARLADSFEAAGGAGPAEFGAYLDAKEVFGDHESPASIADDEADAVRIMSIHAAKGLEFPVVAVPGLSATSRNDSSVVRVSPEGDGLVVAMKLPSAWEGDGKSRDPRARQSLLYTELQQRADALALDERKRLFYVACTRAREVLVLSGELKADGTAADDSMLSWLVGALESAPDCEIRDGRLGVVLGGVRVEVVNVAPAAETAAAVEVGSDTSAAAAEAHRQARHEAVVVAHAQGVAEPTERPAPLPASLSYSDFALWTECPRRFFAQRVVGVRRPESDPVRGADARAFGSAVHAALELSSAREPSRSRLDAIARSFHLDDSQREKLAEAVSAYLRSDVAAEERACESSRRELPFSVRVGERDAGFVLAGTIDLYATRGTSALIVDYKTGTSGDPAELLERYRLQARCYALAALSDGREAVDLAFVRPQVPDANGQPQTLRYRFTAAERSEIEADLLGRYSAIQESEFEPLAEWSERACSECPIADGICPRHPPMRPR